MRAAYCSFSSSCDGTTTSASTVHSGPLSLFAATSRKCLGSRMGFSSPTTSDDLTSSQNFTSECSGQRRSTNPMPRLRRALGNVGNTLSEKRIVPQVGVGIERHRREENHYRLTQGVGGFNRNVERRIVECALRPLHPIDNAAAGRIGSTSAAHRDSGIGEKLLKLVHRREINDSTRARRVTLAAMGVAASALILQDKSRCHSEWSARRLVRPGSVAGRRARSRGTCFRPAPVRCTHTQVPPLRAGAVRSE